MSGAPLSFPKRRVTPSGAHLIDVRILLDYESTKYIALPWPKDPAVWDLAEVRAVTSVVGGLIPGAARCGAYPYGWDAERGLWFHVYAGDKINTPPYAQVRVPMPLETALRLARIDKLDFDFDEFRVADLVPQPWTKPVTALTGQGQDALRWEAQDQGLDSLEVWKVANARYDATAAQVADAARRRRQSTKARVVTIPTGAGR